MTMLATLTVALFAAPLLGGQDADRDGLSDFDEIHKYRTDPRAADSDGDGLPDGDWFERREYTYVVRTVVQVMRPVTIEFLTDDFQDARVLDETAERVELEVLHYPFATAPEELSGDERWRKARRDKELARWLEPGPTSDWDAGLRRELERALETDGIDVERLDDRELVEQVSAWLLQHANYVDSFTTFCTAFDEAGQPFVPRELLEHVNDGQAPRAEDWEAELSAKGMFAQATRGSCTSSAIYLSGCLRALGIPTRTVLCIPLFDAGDEREWDLVREGIRQPYVRRTVLAGMRGLEKSWASHTFNEVWVGGRWWRLDYSELGVGTLRRERFGLLTHVATFRDWADARMPETIGRRQALGLRDAVLDGANPYSTVSVRDMVGEHCTLEFPPAEVLAAVIEALTWTDDPALPEDVRAGIERAERFGLLARVTGAGGSEGLREFLALADARIWLEAGGHPTLGIALDPQCWWYRDDHALVYLPFGPADRRDLVPGVEYRPRARNESGEARLDLDPELSVRRDG